MIGRIGSEGELSKVLFLHLNHDLLILGPQAVEDLWIDHDHKLIIGLIPLALFEDFTQLALNFHTHGHHALDLALSVTERTVIMDRGTNAFCLSLPGHFHEPQLGNRKNVRFGFIPFQTLLDSGIHLLLVLAGFHVDEIKDD